MAELISPADMVRPKAIAPFEAQHAFAAWAAKAREDADAHALDLGRDITADDESVARTWALGFGPPCPLHRESNLDFGLRAAAALFHFIKES